MAAVMAEMPLTIFTTLVPFGAGAFIALAISCLAAGSEIAEGRQYVRDGSKLGLVALAVTGLAFVAAFFHLASPLHAIWAVLGLGSSPLTNEVAAGVAFFVVAAATCVLGLRGKLAMRAWRALLCISAVLAMAFVLLMGLAYSVETVATWSSVYSPFIACSEALAAGALLELAASRVLRIELSSKTRKLMAALIMAGVVAAVVCEALWFVGASSASTALVDASQIAAQEMPAVAAGCALLVAASLLGLASLKLQPPTFPIAAAALFCLGIFFIRIAFYALRISVGLQ